MKKCHSIFAILIVFVVGLAARPVAACQPCDNHPGLDNLDEVIQKSDLIVIGQKIAEGPSTHEEHYWPDWTTLEVLRVIHGEDPGKQLTVNSWDGMCDYGIVLPKVGRFLIFMVKASSEREPYRYDAVNHGCSVKVLPLEEGKVRYKGRLQSIDEVIGQGLLKKIQQ